MKMTIKELRLIIRSTISETVTWAGVPDDRPVSPSDIVYDEQVPVPNDVSVIDDDDIINEVDDVIKPKYKGEFVGHTVTMNDKVVWKKVSWEKDGERHYGKVPSMAKITLVWSGNDWVTMEEFRRGRQMKSGEKESVNDFLKRGGKIKKV